MHRFRDTVFDISNVAIFGYTPLVFYSRRRGSPGNDLRKILCGGHWIARLQNGVKTLPKIFTS